MSVQSSGANKQKNRNYLFEISFLRAFACMAVVGVHVTATHYYANAQTWHWFTYFINQVGRFGTTIFAVLSGFLLFYQVRKRGFNTKKFITSRFSKILLPFLIWSFAYRYMVFHYDGLEFQGLGAELQRLLLGESFYHLYFIAIVVQFYFVFPLLQKIVRSRILMIVFALISLVISYKLFGFNPGVEGALGAFFASKTFMPIWLFYFAFGGVLAYFWEEIVGFATKRPWQMLVLALVVSAGAVVEYRITGQVSNRRLTNLINLPLLCIATIGMYPLLTKLTVIKKPLMVIGQYSMGIYLVHPMTLYLMVEYLPNSVWTVGNIPLLFLAVMVIGVVFIRLLQFIPLSGYVIPVPKIKKARPAQDASAERRLRSA
ncbi:acyltransferase [Metabacillus indicus]|uniref:acyltransferase n=1 Tax=Metabacillus indicus TaxID=246786 RepID=UPI00248F6A33|nr:acyltransferase [Metabacillus indicus]